MQHLLLSRAWGGRQRPEAAVPRLARPTDEPVYIERVRRHSVRRLERRIRDVLIDIDVETVRRHRVEGECVVHHDEVRRVARLPQGRR